MQTRLKEASYWAVPSLLSLVIYWPGLMAWFQKDDFAWLGLRDMVHSWADLRWALFTPLAQGTLRVLSERVMYLSFYSLFGLNAFPYRCLAFVTHFATLVLLSLVCWRLTGSRAAGFWAAILYAVNAAIGYPLSWTAIYYELLCAFFFLLDLWLLIRYVETGRRLYLGAQWLTFLTGFGVLEINVVYPALAFAYASCCARRVIPRILPMFLVSAAYVIWHTTASPLPAGGVYKLHWDAGIATTFWTYFKSAMGPNRLIYLGIHPSAIRSILTVMLVAGLLGFLIWKLSKREWPAGFFAAWFVIVLAPVLPLRDHISDYYLTVPLIGLAMLGGWAIASGWRAGVRARAAAVILAAIYLGVSIPVAHVNAASFHDRSLRIRTMMYGVADLRRSNPGKVILLRGMDFDMFWSSIFHRPFRLMGIDDVYVFADDADKIMAGDQAGDARKFFMNPNEARKALAEGRAVVYNVEHE